MKSSYQQFIKSSIHHLNNVYFISGESLLLKEELLHKIIQVAKQQGFSDKEIFNITPRFNWQSVIEASQVYPLFAEKKIIIIYLNQYKLSAQLIEQLPQLLKQQETLVIFLSDKIDAKTRHSAWLNQIINKGCVIEIWPFKRHEYTSWLNSQAQALGLTLNDSIIHRIIISLENNLFAAKQCLQKLALLNQNTPDEKALQSILEALPQYNNVDLLNAISEQDGTKIIRIIEHLHSMREPASHVLSIFLNQIRKCTQLKYAIMQGESINNSAKQLNIYTTHLPAIEKTLSYLTLNQWYDCFSQALNIEKKIKIDFTWPKEDFILLSLFMCAQMPLRQVAA